MNRHLITLFLATVCISASLSAQENAIKFNVLPVEGDELPAATSAVIERKLAAALNRSQASTEDTYNVFAVRPEITLAQVAETEGLIREVARISAEMTISAVNTVDGIVYHSVTVPLKGSAPGGKDAAMKAMVNSMKATDPVYVRFVRTARARIDDYYAENCGNIIEQARRLVTLKQYDRAANYLSAVPTSVSCYDQATVLLEEIAPYLDQAPDTVIVEHVVEVPVEHIVEVPTQPDTVVVEKVVEVPVTVERYPEPQSPAPKPKITIDGTELDFKVVDCFGDLSRGRITIKAKITNSDRRTPKPYVIFNTVITDSGRELTDLKIKECDLRSYNFAMPDGVPVMMTFEIIGVKERYASFSYVEISVRGIKVSIRDLAIKW